jgi:hypothetical protein
MASDPELQSLVARAQRLSESLGRTPDSFAEFARQVVTPLELLPSVEDRGVGGQERIYLRAHQRVSLRNYLLLAGVQLPDNTFFPLPDHALWLGTDTLETGTWLIVYTGPGTPMVSFIRGNNEAARVLYWNKDTTIFNDNRVVPILMYFDPALAQFGVPPQ